MVSLFDESHTYLVKSPDEVPGALLAPSEGMFFSARLSNKLADKTERLLAGERGERNG